MARQTEARDIQETDLTARVLFVTAMAGGQCPP